MQASFITYSLNLLVWVEFEIFSQNSPECGLGDVGEVVAAGGLDRNVPRHVFLCGNLYADSIDNGLNLNRKATKSKKGSIHNGRAGGGGRKGPAIMEK